MQAVRQGLVPITLTDDFGGRIRIDFTDALSVRGLETPLISVHSLSAQGCTITFNENSGVISTQRASIKFGPDHLIKCTVNEPPTRPSIHTALSVDISDASAALWRARFNHAGRRLVERTINLRTDTGNFRSTPETFTESDLAKMKALPFNGTRTPSTRPFERIHSDVLGPIKGQSAHVARFAIVFKDDFTSYTSIYMMHTKSEAPAKLQLYLDEMGANSLNHRLAGARLHLDGASELTSSAWTAVLRRYDMLINEVSVPDNPQTNGLAERALGTLIPDVRAMCWL
jgi:hypothetical protein